MINIYLITNLINGKYYVGKTSKNLIARFSGHFRSRNCKKTALGAALNEYGAKNFSVELLTTIANDKADEMEKLWICTLQANNRLSGYNLTLGGDGGPTMLGRKHSEQTKLKMSRSSKGKLFSQEHKNNISKSKLGSKDSEETKLKKSIARLGKNNPRYGKIWSLEERAKLASYGMLGKKHSEATREKMRKSRMNRKIGN
ncbi:MAG: NUMOD3 domain-containing DNA-binding protein [Patescibacteria group bacterium]